MKSSRFHAPRDIRLEEMPVPEPGVDEIVIRTAFCGICGSDIHSYTKGLFVSLGQTLGHEFSGTVTKVGSQVHGIALGMRVCINAVVGCEICDFCLHGQHHLCEQGLAQGIGVSLSTPGGLAEYVRIPHARLGQNVYLLPPHVSDEEGALVEPLSVAVHAIRLAKPQLNDTVVVLGAGPIGLCAVAVLKSLGALQVLVSDVSPLRLEVAQHLGADAVVNPAEEQVTTRLHQMTQQRTSLGRTGADIVIEAAGVPQTLLTAFQAVRHGGTILCIALHEQPVVFDPSILIIKELKLLGALGYEDEFQASIDLIARRKVNLKPLITHQFGLDDLTAAFETQCNPQQAIKVLVKGVI